MQLEKKCTFENAGNCKKPDCLFLHPKKTCQAHSKYGSCPSESICEHRHPSGICWYLQNRGFCFEAEKCRMRHPVEFSSHFLVQNLPSPHHGFQPEGARGGRGGRNAQYQEDDSPQLPQRRDSWDNQNYNVRARGRGANRGQGGQF